MNKVIASAAEAVADVADGAMIAFGGFGHEYTWATTAVQALRAQGTRNLTAVATAMGGPGELGPMHLIENHQVRHIIASFTLRVGAKTASEEQIRAGTITAELVGQGIVAERCRAGAAGIPAFWSPTGAGTDIAEGKDVRYFDGKPHVLEHAIRPDFAFVRAIRADRAGNLQFRGNTRNFNVSFAKSARITIAEVDEIVETGELSPDNIDLPGIFVQRVIKSTYPMDAARTSRSTRRPADSARSYNGKEALSRLGIARRAAALIKTGSYVNLGSGVPELVSNFLGDRDVLLHAENGMLGYGSIVSGEDIDPYVYNAGSAYVSTEPGAAFFDSVTSFEMARGGHLDTVIIGAYEVDETASVANWSTANPLIRGLGGIGGAMDLVAGGSELIVVMEHQDSKGRAKLRRKCVLPLTGRDCVSWVVTDLALFRRDDSKGCFVLEETAPGFTVEEVLALTEMKVEVAPSVKSMA